MKIKTFLFIYFISIASIFGQTNKQGTIIWGLIDNSLDTLLKETDNNFKEPIRIKTELLNIIKNSFDRKIVFNSNDTICIYLHEPLLDVNSRTVIQSNNIYTFGNSNGIKYYTHDYTNNLYSTFELFKNNLIIEKNTNQTYIINGFNSYKTIITNKSNSDTVIAYCSKDIKINPLSIFSNFSEADNFFEFFLEDSPILIEKKIEGVKIKYGIISYSNEKDSSFNINTDTTDYSKFEDVYDLINKQIIEKKNKIFSGKGKNLNLLVSLVNKYKLDSSLIISVINSNQSYDSLSLVLEFCNIYIKSNSKNYNSDYLDQLQSILRNEKLISNSTNALLLSNSKTAMSDKNESFINLLKKNELLTFLSKSEIKDKIIDNFYKFNLNLKSGESIKEAKEFKNGNWDLSELIANIKNFEPVIVDSSFSTINSLVISLQKLLISTFKELTTLKISVKYDSENNDLIVNVGDYKYYYKNGFTNNNNNAFTNNIFRVFPNEISGRKNIDTLSINNFYNLIYPSLVNQIIVDNNLDIGITKINLCKIFQINCQFRNFKYNDLIYVYKREKNNLNILFSLENFDDDDFEPNCISFSIDNQQNNTFTTPNIPTKTKIELLDYIKKNKKRLDISDIDLLEFEKNNINQIKNDVCTLLDYNNIIILSNSYIECPYIKSKNFSSTFPQLYKFLRSEFKPANFHYNYEESQENINVSFSYGNQKINIITDHYQITEKFLIEINKYFIFSKLNDNRIYYNVIDNFLNSKCYYYLSSIDKENFENILNIKLMLLTE